MMDSYYELASNDELNELFETELDPTMQDVLRLHAAGDLTVEWSFMEKDLPGVIIHDKLMTDAALGTRPIKTEHSYSLASDGDSLPDSPNSHQKMDDMEEECFPAIPMRTACRRLSSSSVEIKEEPMSETESLTSSCPSSPQSALITNNSDLQQFSLDLKTSQQLFKHSNLLLTSSPHTILSQRIQVPKMNIKLEKLENSVGFQLPPTPPSCSSSEDSEDNATISQPPSPGTRKTTTARVILNHHTTTRQPIHTPLISCQPKGSTGSLLLTEEEKRTLIAEGYPVPTRLPLTKAEEKSLKKIRRKIKNKISAQESRRKKKEYMDQLEKKVEVLVNENNVYRKKIETLEDSNNNLLSQLQKLQAIVAKTHPQFLKQLK